MALDDLPALHRIPAKTDLAATTSDEALARRIGASIQQNPAATPCPPHSVLEQQPASRPAQFDLSRLKPRSISGLAVCEYDNGAEETSRLRASRELSAREARVAVAAILAGSTTLQRPMPRRQRQRVGTLEDESSDPLLVID